MHCSVLLTGTLKFFMALVVSSPGTINPFSIKCPKNEMEVCRNFHFFYLICKPYSAAFANTRGNVLTYNIIHIKVHNATLQQLLKHIIHISYEACRRITKTKRSSIFTWKNPFSKSITEKYLAFCSFANTSSMTGTGNPSFSTISFHYR